MNSHVKYGNSWATLESSVNVLIFGVESQNTIRNGISKTENDLKHSMFLRHPTMTVPSSGYFTLTGPS